jgi:hypothetical protein
MLAAVIQPKPHLDDFFFARRQRLQHRRRLLLQVQVDHRIRRRNHGLVFDEIAQVRIFLFPDRRLQRNRLLRNLQDLAHLGHRNVHALGDLFTGRLATELLHQLAARPHQLIDRLDHVHRDADGARLIGNRAGDGLADPPSRVGRKLVAAAPFELVHGLHQANVALLDQIQELQAAVGIFLRDRHDEAQVGLNQFLLRLFGFRFAPVNDRQRALQLGQPDFAGLLNILQLRTPRTQFAPRFRRVLALGHVRAPLQPPSLALQRLQALHRAAHFVDQPLLLKRVEFDPADFQRNRDACPRHFPLRANVLLLLRFRRLVELHRLLQRQVVKLRDLLDVLQRLLGLVGDLLFGQFFIVKLDDFLDRPRALAQVIPNRDQFLDDDRRTSNRLHHHQLPALNPLRDGHFAFARQQRHRAHLAQVHAHRIVGLFERTRRQIQVAALGLVTVVLDHRITVAVVRRHLNRARRFRRRRVFVNLDAVAFECGQKVVDLFRRMHLRRKRIVYFVIQQVPPLFADGNELAYCIIFFL